LQGDEQLNAAIQAFWQQALLSKYSAQFSKKIEKVGILLA